MDAPFPQALGIEDVRDEVLHAWRKRLALTLASFTLVDGGTRACGAPAPGGQDLQPGRSAAGRPGAERAAACPAGQSRVPRCAALGLQMPDQACMHSLWPAFRRAQQGGRPGGPWPPGCPRGGGAQVLGPACGPPVKPRQHQERGEADGSGRLLHRPARVHPGLRRADGGGGRLELGLWGWRQSGAAVVVEAGVAGELRAGQWRQRACSTGDKPCSWRNQRTPSCPRRAACSTPAGTPSTCRTPTWTLSCSCSSCCSSAWR